MSVDFQRAFLTSAFGGAEGGVTVAHFIDDAPTTFVLGEDGNDASVLRDDVESWVDLRTTAGEVVGICSIHDTSESANAFIAEHAEPSLSLRDEETIALVYLFEAPVMVDGDLPTKCPLPGGPFQFAFEEDEPTDGVLPAVKFDSTEVLGWFDGDDRTPMNDAFIYGELDSDTLDRKIIITTGKNRTAKRWVSKETTIRDFIIGLSKNQVGPKDGIAFTQGEIRGTERRGNLVSCQYVLGLDVDVGFDMEALHKMVSDLGLLTVIYTTHSHLSTTTEIGESVFNKWLEQNNLEANEDSCRRYLIEEKGYHPPVLNTLVFHGRQLADGTGTVYLCDHTPMPKFRVVFFLEHPFDVMSEAASTDGARKKWARKLYGIARKLGNLPIDQKCIDLARLFYLPRRKRQDSPFEIRILAGKLLDLDSIEEVDPKRIDLFDEAAARMGSGSIGDSRKLKNGLSIKRWAKDRADGFQIAEVFRQHAPDRIRQDQSEDKLTVECPFDGMHSNPGDTSDAGCWVQNGASATSDSGFAFACSHNGCRGHDRLDMLCEALDHDWFPESVLLDESFQALLIEDIIDEEKPESTDENDEDGDSEEPDEDITSLYSKLYKQAEALTEASTPTEFRGILRKAIHGELPSMEFAKIKQKIVKKTGLRQKDVEDEVKIVEAKHRRSKRKKNDDGEPEDLLAAEEAQFINENGLKPLRGAIPLFASAYENDEYAFVKRLAGAFSRQNQKNPRVYNYGGRKIVAVLNADNDYELTDINEKILAEEVNKVITKFVQRDGEQIARERVTQEEIVNLMYDVDIKYPNVERFEEMPFYARDGRIVYTNGYDTDTQTLLVCAPDIEIPDFAFDSNPSQDLVDEAVNAFFDELFYDFPFDDLKDTDTNGNGSRCHLLAMMLQPLIRRMIDGRTPFYLVDKPSPGTGGSLLVKSALMVSTGNHKVETETEKGNNSDDEWRKNITSALSAGKKDIWFDNIRFKLDSGSLANLATADVWSDRRLGSTTIVTFKNWARIVLSGNNVRMSDELLRRSLMIRVDYKKGDPTLRNEDDFKIKNIEEHVMLNRGRYYAYLMVLVNNWIAKGKPLYQGKGIASFENWSRITGGILLAADIEGFLSNVHLTSGRAASQRTALNTFATGLFNKFGFESVLMTDVQNFCETWNDLPAIDGANSRTFESFTSFNKFFDGIKNSPFTVYRPEHPEGDFYGTFHIDYDPKNPTRLLFRIKYADESKNKARYEVKAA